MTNLAAQRDVTLEGARREGWPRVAWHGTYIGGETAWRNAVAWSLPKALDELAAGCAAVARARDVERAAQAAGWPALFWRSRLLTGEGAWRAGLEAAVRDGMSWEELESLRKHLVYGTPLDGGIR